MWSATKPGSFLFSADASFTFYTPRAGGAHPLPGAAKDAKRPFLVRRKIMGPPKSPIGFLGKRKHNGAMSFFRVSEKTISGVRADEVAVNFSACTLL